MATTISLDGNTTSSFKYNTIYGLDEQSNLVASTKIDPTGNGILAYIRGKRVATKYRGTDIKNNEVGSTFGAETSRTGTTLGNVTKTSSFSYNDGIKGEVPQYHDDTLTRDSDLPYVIGNTNVLTLRNSTTADGVSDDNKIAGEEQTEQQYVDKLLD